jgi:hypothetical protein
MQSSISEDFYKYAVEKMTLTQALSSHYVLNPQFTIWSNYKSGIAQKLVKAHDISHIIFGCDTSLLGEMRVQLWAKFGVQKFAFQESITYARNKEARVLLKNPVGYWAMFLFFLKHFDEVRKVRAKSKVMFKKWHYFQEDLYMTKTIGEIREQFGIDVVDRSEL